jgi:hypothetical protein
MLRRLSEIKNFALAARDGEIGKVKELYFDDESWVTRYLVADTGGWLTGRQVLVSPKALGMINEERQVVSVDLTKSQVEKSPSIETDKPVTRQYEEAWHQYYGYPGYWFAPEAIAFGTTPPLAEVPPADREPREKGDPHLRSTSEVTGYSIHANDGDIGHVDDFIVDDGDWMIRYIVISRGGLPGRTVILATEWTDQVSWEERKVFVPLTREAIKDAPEWNEAQPITRAFETRLHDYYGRKGYWPIDV